MEPYYFCAGARAIPKITIFQVERKLTCKAEAGYEAYHWEIPPADTDEFLYLALGAKLTWSVTAEATGDCTGTVTASGTSYRPSGIPSGPPVEDTLLVATETYPCSAFMEITLKVTVTATTDFGVQSRRLADPLHLLDGTVVTHGDTPSLGQVTVTDEHEDQQRGDCPGSG